MSTEIIDKVISYALDKGRNVFLTGPGGTGKTFAINRVIEECEMRGIVFAATATTAAAALNFPGGRTLHSFSGIRLGRDSKEILAKNVLPPTRKKIKETAVLIIDEISMLGKGTIEKIDYVLKCVRKDHDYAFGGITVIASGDFLQLPPVDDEYAFASFVWEEFKFKTIVFNKPHRFVDPNYFKMLQRIRYGIPSKNDILRLSYRNYKDYDILPVDSLIIPTKLFSRINDVMNENMRELEKIKFPKKTYTAEDTIIYRKNDGDLELNKLTSEELGEFIENKISMKVSDYATILDDMVDREVHLKDTAQAMLIYNLDPVLGYVNGSRCIVKTMTNTGVYATFIDGKTVFIQCNTWERRIKGNIWIKRKQIPFMLGYALTIHKCQGATLDCAEIDLGPSVFANSQAYVAISRVRTLDGLYLSNFVKGSIRSDPKAVDFTRKIELSHVSPDNVLPD
jgi:ATP-dependent DNA helicase PIF1